MSGIWEHLHDWAAPLCHQLPERSMGAGGLRAPLCLRCSAFYASFLFAFVLLLATKWTRRIAPGLGLAVALATTAVMAADALLWPSHNVLRHMTGTLAGLGVALVAGPTLARALDTSAVPGRATTAWVGLAGVGACVALLYPWSLAGGRAPVVVSTLAALLGLLLLGFTANALLVGTCGGGRRTPAIALALLLLELAFMGGARN